MHSAPMLRKITAIEPAAVGLWAVAGSWSSDHLTDGLIPDDDLPWLFPDAPRLAQALVAAGAWKRVRNGHRFVPDDSLYKLPAKEAVDGERRAGARRQALFRDAGLKKEIRDRDCDRCRYCGIPVRWGKGRATDSGTFDHVDPQGSNTLANIVVACMACNSRKKDRTPDQAGMPLLPTPGDASRKGSTEASGEASREAYLSNPSRSVVDVVNQVAGSKRLADDDLILRTIIDLIHERTGRVIAAADARRIADSLLTGRNANDPAAYVRKAITAEPNPRQRFLPPEDDPPPGPCGLCNPYRRLEDGDGNDAGPCPRCIPASQNGTRT